MGSRSSKRRKDARPQRRARGAKSTPPERREIPLDALRAIIARAENGPLGSNEREQLLAAVETLAFITAELEKSKAAVARLQKLLFGSSSEKTRDVLGTAAGEERGSTPASATGGDVQTESGGAAELKPGTAEKAGDAAANDKKSKKGHGRIGADAYTGAQRVPVAHDSLKHGDRCPACPKGKVYRMAIPAVLVRVRAVAPLEATVHHLERLRCNLCGQIFTARAPPGVGEEKYDETAAAMIALLKYGCGLPFNRLERLGGNLGIPLPAATQWEVVSAAGEACEPVWTELITQAAAGDVVHIDDTNATVLSIVKEIEDELAASKDARIRTGIFTSGVVSTVTGGRQIALFFTGRKHAGENLAKVLEHRCKDLPPPIQMCDALSRNTSPGEFKTILANCVAHLRRNFVDVVDSFPAEVERVLETFREVYRHEAATCEKGMSHEERLAHHKEHSGPLLEELKNWLDGLITEKKVEPSSGLGQAIQYLDNHWEALTLFLRVPGAPLDNNVCERALKRAIMHRKNSLFFKTENGAHVGDMFLSLIHTAELCGANPFDYLVAVQRHAEAVEANPEQWMPWNFAETLARIHANPAK